MKTWLAAIIIHQNNIYLFRLWVIKFSMDNFIHNIRICCFRLFCWEDNQGRRQNFTDSWLPYRLCSLKAAFHKPTLTVAPIFARPQLHLKLWRGRLFGRPLHFYSIT